MANPEEPKQQRRPSLGQSAGKLLKRASSLGRLMKQGSSRSIKDDDTCASSHGDQDQKLKALSKVIKEQEMKLKHCEAAIQKQIHNNIKVALTRYTDRKATDTAGAYEYMRKAHKNRIMYGHSVVARMELVDLRQQVDGAVLSDNYMNMIASEQKYRMNEILNKLNEQQKQCPPMSDKEARKELKKILLHDNLDSYF